MSKLLKTIPLIFILLIFIGKAGAQLSPGKLSKAHAHLEGLTNCTKCHVLGEKEITSKCLECHTEIKKLMDAGRGYHASEEVKGNDCQLCHGEHFGRDFELVYVDTQYFEHQLTGFELQGKHAEIKCLDCHKSELIQSGISKKKEGHTWLGLDTGCLSCHTDFHQNTLSNNCLSCHNQEAFRPAPKFEHASTDFPLVGKHQTVDCEKCHLTEQRNGEKFQQFEGVSFTSCTDCHEDVHRNRFGNDCRKCHNENSFNSVEGLSDFNHEPTGFPLRGMHRAVQCNKCHTSGNYTKNLQYQRCTDCHSDYHENQFAENGISPDCSECHTVNGFFHTSFGIEEHNRRNFALDGAHLATPCLSCHKKNPQEKWDFDNMGNQCVDCHKNIHENYMNTKYLADKGCENCHSVSIWNEIRFDHSQTDFQLQGKHTGVSCRECHFIPSPENRLKQQFTWASQSCTNCHKDIHNGQFKNEGKTDCLRCHVFNHWNPEKFNHNTARFPLDGKHKALECNQCHKTKSVSDTNYIVYKFKDISCASCH